MTAGAGVGTIVTVPGAATGSAFVGATGAVDTTTGAGSIRSLPRLGALLWSAGSAFSVLRVLPSSVRGCTAGCAAGAEA